MLNRNEYEVLVEKLAGEYCEEYLGKEAGIVGYFKGDRDFSDPEDQKTKFWGDRVAPYVIGAGSVAGIAAQKVSDKTVGKSHLADLNAKRMEAAAAGFADIEKNNALLKSHFAPKMLAAGAAVAGVGAGARYLRGKNMAENNGVDFTGGDAAKSTFIPFVTEDSIVKKKVRNKAKQEDVVKKAAELLIEAVMVKEASIAQMQNADMYVEAAEHALNYMGYELALEK